MCNEVERIQYFIRQWRDKSLHEIFSKLYVKPQFQYQNVFPEHCMICKRSLTEYEMWPPGRCPRSMCEVCYQREIIQVINKRCIISGNVLPKYKISAQRLNSREVENNIADGQARDYYTLLACKVVGLDMRFVIDDAHGLLPVSSKHYQDNYDAIDADYQVVPQLPTSYAHDHSLSYPLLPEDTSHKHAPVGRKIKFIPKNKKVW